MGNMTRCWICLGTDEDAPPSPQGHRWRHPCQCSLAAHELCLLDWVAEVVQSHPEKVAESDSSRHNHRLVVPCPQCKADIVIEDETPWLLYVRQKVEQGMGHALMYTVFATTGAAATYFVHSTLYGLGALAIRSFCTPEMATELLRIRITPTAIEILPPTLNQTLLIPLIPIALVGSRFGTHLIAGLIPLTRLAAVAPHRYFDDYHIFAWLPLLKVVYDRVYRLTVHRALRHFAQQARPQLFQEHPNGVAAQAALGDPTLLLEQEAAAMRAQVENNAPVPGAFPRNPAVAAAPPAADAAPGLAPGLQDIGRELLRLRTNGDDAAYDAVLATLVDRARDEHGFVDAEQVMGFLEGFFDELTIDNDVTVDELMQRLEEYRQERENAAAQEANVFGQAGMFDRILAQAVGAIANTQQPAAPQPTPSADPDISWILGQYSLLTRVGNALLFPLYCGAVGGLLSGIPIVRSVLTTRVRRNILGGVLLILIRDGFNIVTAYLRVRQLTSKRVRNFRPDRREDTTTTNRSHGVLPRVRFAIDIN